MPPAREPARDSTRLPVRPTADDPLAFLYGRIDYERTPPPSSRPFKLHVMRSLLERLGNPQEGQAIVHIAGTKGKGSTATMVAAILQAAGFRTGLYTSPHLESIGERLAVAGQPCELDEFRQLVDEARPAVQALDQEAERSGLPGGGPTFFDIVTALALVHFARRGCTATVLEVGLGGRLDSTNVCQPAVSVITTISFDHMQQLGNTLAQIAGEKAGIIKPGVPVVSGVLPSEPREVIAATAQQIGAPLFAVGEAFDYRETAPERPTTGHSGPSGWTFDYWDQGVPHPWRLERLPRALRGAHQALNGAVATATIRRLVELGWPIPLEAVRAGLAAATCPARVEVVSERPTLVLDAAHNVASIDALLSALDRDFPHLPRIAIFAVNRDKDVAGILERLLPAFPRVIVTHFQHSPRALPLDELLPLAQRLAPPGTAVEPAATAAEALDRARRTVPPDSLICVTGSFFLAAEVRGALPGSAPADSR
ncbi:MAG: folylpolyglutamate synthase/dihydrofolate synthase family protein [Pirellulales bacterium]